MSRLFIILAFFSLFILEVNSQNLNQVSLRFSPTQFELNFQRKLILEKVWSEAFIGLGNQGINSNYDDYLAGLRIGTPLFFNEKSTIHLAAIVGVYLPNNDFYAAVTPVFGLLAGYSRYIGKPHRHSMLIHLGYQYGQRNYIHEYRTNDISIATTGNFKLSPIHFSIGYGYNF